jgi:hypothetical protein
VTVRHVTNKELSRVWSSEDLTSRPTSGGSTPRVSCVSQS